MSQWYSPHSLPRSPCAKKQRITHVTAIFSDEWNSSFSPRNVRSRRQRFSNCGESISGFTAIFCDDWRDDIEENIWASRREMEEDVAIFAQQWNSSHFRHKRQREESPVDSLSFSATSPESQTSLNATSPEPRVYELEEFELEKWPSSPGKLFCDINSSLVDIDENLFLMPRSVLPEDLLPNIPILEQVIDLDLSPFEQADLEIYLELNPDEVKDSSVLESNLKFETKAANSMLHLCEEASGEVWSQNERCEAGSGGFEFWAEFMKCCLDVHSDHDVQECQLSNETEDS